MRANADLQSGSYLFVRPSKMKAGSIFIMREPRVEAQRRNSLFISIKQSPSRAKAGLAPTIAKTPCAGGGGGGVGGDSSFCLKNGIVRLQIQDRRISPRPARAQSTEKFFPSLACQELDSGRVLVARAAKVQRNPGIQARKENTDKACSESIGDWCFF